MKNILLTTGLIGMCSLMMGCNVELKSDGAKGAAKPAAKAQGIKGPNINGEWDTGCIDVPFATGAKRRIIYTFKNKTFEYNEINYRDPACTQAIAADPNGPDQDFDGTFIFKKALANKVYTLEMTVKLGASGWTTSRYMNLKLEGTKVLVTELYGSQDSLGSLSPNITALNLEAIAAEEAAQAEEAASMPAPTPATPSLALRSGIYSTTGDWCDQSISTQSSGGRVETVYVDFINGCSGSNNLYCDSNGKCIGGGHTLQILSETQYKYTNRYNETVIFVKR